MSSVNNTTLFLLCLFNHSVAVDVLDHRLGSYYSNLLIKGLFRGRKSSINRSGTSFSSAAHFVAKLNEFKMSAECKEADKVLERILRDRGDRQAYDVLNAYQEQNTEPSSVDENMANVDQEALKEGEGEGEWEDCDDDLDEEVALAIDSMIQETVEVDAEVEIAGTEFLAGSAGAGAGKEGKDIRKIVKEIKRPRKTRIEPYFPVTAHYGSRSGSETCVFCYPCINIV